MNTSRICLLTAVISAIFSGAQTADAQGLLGERYFKANVGFIVLSDRELGDVLGTGLTLSGALNIPCTENLDFFFSIGHERFDGDTVIMSVPIEIDASQTSVLGGTTYHFAPQQRWDPFVGTAIGVGIVRVEARVPSLPSLPDSQIDETGFRWDGFAGVEIDLSETVAIAPIISYSNIENEHFRLRLRLSHWFSENAFETLTAGSVLDEGDFFMHAGFGLAF